MNGKKWDVFSYGDVNLDVIVPGVERLPAPGTEEYVPVMENYVGGGAVLFAMGCAKLGLNTVFQGSVGDDHNGRFIREELKRVGLDDSLLATVDTPKTGISISFTGEKDRCFLTYRGTNEGISLKYMDLESARKARHVHVTGYAGSANHEEYLQLLEKLREGAKPPFTVSLDLGWDPTGEWCERLPELFPYIDILFMNETESIHYSREATAEAAAKKFAAQSGLTVVAKLGKTGSLAVRRTSSDKPAGDEMEKTFAPGLTVKAVDTTGAGDSFNAGFIYGWLKGLPLEDCLRCGNICGAMSVTKTGGNTGFPTEAELKGLFKGERL